MKRCTRCKQELDSTAFTHNAGTSDGHARHCRECESLDRQEYYARKPEKRKAQIQNNYQRHQEEIRAKARAYYQSHREWALEYARAWATENRDKVAEYARDHRAKNPIGYRAANQRRRLKEHNTDDGTVTVATLCELLSTWTGVCPICTKEAAPTIDHITPLARGGEHTLTNLQLMCGVCNSSKGAREV